jgi:hypothetical protein
MFGMGHRKRLVSAGQLVAWMPRSIYIYIIQNFHPGLNLQQTQLLFLLMHLFLAVYQQKQLAV